MAASNEKGQRAERLRVPIVGIGASAGGLDALRELFRAMPSDTGAAYVVVQHLDPTRESAMAELLSRVTSMPVHDVRSGVVVARDSVYVLPPAYTMVVASGVLQLRALPELRTHRHPIDEFLSSLADDRGARAVAVILSGTGTDGSHGIRAVKQAGGLVIAQEPSSAAHDGMPRAALATGMVDAVLAPADMPATIGNFVQHPYARDGAEALADDSASLDRVLSLLGDETGHAFTGYKRGTLARRVYRRMGLAGIRDVDAYLEHLAGDVDEARHLYADCLIGVTRFFRDPDVFARLESEVLPSLLAGKGTHDNIRAWVPGCATGEEAYSVAMLLLERLTATAHGRDVIVFATDIDERALAIAREGIYSEEKMAGVSPDRRNRFFRRDGDGWRVGRELREAMVFAPQNLIGDPPFSQLDLVTCRNVLIYFQPEIQRKLIGVFHFALRDRGILVLGGAEGIAGRTELFDTVSERWRIFRRIPGAHREALDLPRVAQAKAIAEREPGVKRKPPLTMREIATRALAHEYGPPAVLCDAHGEALYFSGDTAPFLEVPAGDPTRNLLELARPELRGRLRLALHQAVRDRSPVRERATLGDADLEVTVEVRPVDADGEGDGVAFLVAFERRQALPPVAAPTTPEQHSAVDRLERELQDTRNDLQATIEELEAANEELKASNEEIMSMNEELQSTNEELETSKEELQSLNEELNTVNAQLQEKLLELQETNDDIENLFTSTDLATLFLDRDMKVKRFTPAALRLFNLIEADVGRSIGDISVKFSGGDLVADARSVLTTLVPIDDEVALHDDVFYARRILPYRTTDDRIDGVVVTFADISSQKRAEHQISRARDQLEHQVAERTAELREANEALSAEVVERTAAEHRLRTVLATAADAIVSIDERGIIESTNAAADRMFGYEAGELVGCNVNVLMPSPYHERHDDYLARYHRTHEPRIMGVGREVVGKRKDGETFAADLAVGEAQTADGRRYTGIIRDVSDRKRLEEEIRQAQKMEAVGRLASGVAHDFNNLLMGINGAASVALSRADEGNPTLALLQEIQTAAKEGASISRQLLAVARKREIEYETLDVVALIGRARTLLGRLIGEDVELAVEVPDHPLWIRGDEGQLEQVLLNLAVNARDAMPYGGRIVLSAVAAVLDPAEARSRNLAPGAFALVSVRDTGQGIPADALPHIFEPFFTTKEPGKGTGLGLSTVYSIVKQAGGHIDVATGANRGTEFTIYLSQVEAPARTELAAPESTPSLGGATVLLVEDEPLVRMAVRHYLERGGYQVLDANDHDEALEVARSHDGPISLLVTDVVLPKISGVDIAAKLASERPGLATLFMSAHPTELLVEQQRLPEGISVLQKPFGERQLIESVNEVLAAKPVATGTLMVVDDDRAAREACRELLAEAGHEVLAAANASEALLAARAHGEAIDVLLTDVGLPDLAGGDLVERLREEVPIGHVIYLSGRSADDPEVQCLLEDPRASFVPKPFDFADLEALVTQAISRAASS